MHKLLSKRGSGTNLFFSLLVLALALIGLAIVQARAPEVLPRFFMASWQLNSIIVAVFLFGIFYALFSLLRLQREFASLAHVQSRFEAGEDRNWMEAPALAMLPYSMVRERLTLYAEQAKRGCPPEGESHMDRVSRSFGLRTSTTRYIAGLLVFLGLLGTFVGLLLSLGSIHGLIEGMSTGTDDAGGTEFLEALKVNLAAPLAGMGTAFSTSVFGLVTSLIVGFLHLQLASAQNRYITRLETFDSAFVVPSVRARATPAVPVNEAAVQLSSSQLVMKENLERIEAVVERTEKMQANFRDVMVTLGREIETTNEAIVRLASNQDLIREASGSQVDLLRGQGEKSALMVAELQGIREGLARMNALAKAGQEGDREFHQEFIRVLRREVGGMTKMKEAAMPRQVAGGGRQG